MKEKEVTYNYYIDKDCEKETKERCKRKYLSDVDLHVNSIENAIILPGDSLARGGVMLNGDLLPHSSIYNYHGRVYEFDETDIVNSNEEVVYIWMWAAIWGHCLTDNIKHLWFVLHPEYDYLKKYKWVYSLIWGNLDENHNFWKLLKKWEIDTGNIYRIEKPTQYKRVFLPDGSFIFDKKGNPMEGSVVLYTKEFARLYNNLVIPTPKTDIPLNDRVYLTRTGFGKGKDYGEKCIEDAFRKMGYQVVFPEKLKLDELICILRHCKVLATSEGSISHNALFLNEGTALVLIRKAYHVNSHQLPINEMRRLQVTIIDSHKSVANDKNRPWRGPFFLYCGKNLKKFAPEVKYRGFPLKGFFVYLKKTNYLKKYFKELLKKSWFYRIMLKLMNFGSDRMS